MKRNPGAGKCKKAAETATLVIIRHAHRNKAFGAEADNGLSAKGRRQARAAARFFKKRFKGRKPNIFSSPKRRCRETLEPIAKLSGREIQIVDCLNESESPTEIRHRILRFRKLLQGSNA